MLKNITKKLCEKYIMYLNFFRMLEWEIIRRWAKFEDMDVVLDVGCGTGFFTDLCGLFSYGIDVDEKNIEIAKRHRDSLFCAGDATSLPFRDEFFDKIISICVLEHIQDDFIALKEMKRVLKKNGKLFLTVDSGLYLPEKYKKFHLEHEDVKRFYDIDALRLKLKYVGFDICRFRYILNSWVSYKLFGFWEKRNFNRFWYFAFFVFYPLSIVFDFFADRNKGMILVVEANAS